MTQTPSPWTADDLAKLKKLAGSSLSEMQSELGRSISSIRRRCKQNSIEFRDARTPVDGPMDRAPRTGRTQWSDDEFKRLTELSMQNASIKEMAAEVGRTPVAVRSKCRQLGLHFRDTRPEGSGQNKVVERNRRWTPEMLAELAELAKGFSIAEIADHYGLASGTIIATLKHYGIPGRGKSAAARDPRATARRLASRAANRDEKYPRSGPWLCTQCGVEQPIENFYQASGERRRDGKTGPRAENHTCRRCQRAYRLRHYYNITIDQYEVMLAEQGGVCACCGKPESATQRGAVLPLSVDHSHLCCPGKLSCGKCVRELLCRECNRRVEAFETEGWAMYANYLERHR